MSKAWPPDEAMIPLHRGAVRRARGLRSKEWERLKREWREEVHGRPLPRGSRTALALLALACIGVAAGLYALAGPRDVFERDVKGDWSAVEEAARSR